MTHLLTKDTNSFSLHLFFLFCQVTISLNICATIATAMGPNVNRHLKILGPGIFSTLADAKVRRIQFTQVSVKSGHCLWVV